MIFHLTSKKPILVVGNGVRSAEAKKLLLEFAEKTSIPVLTTMNGVDLIQDELRIGFIGVYGNRAANMIVNSADLVIAVGARLGLRQVGNAKAFFAPNARLIRADIDQYELSRSIKEDEEKYLIDAAKFLQELLGEEIPRYDAWKRRCFAVKELLAETDQEPGNLCIRKIAELLPPDPVIAVDVGQNLCWSAQSFSLKGQRGRILIGGGYGSMGCALPFAIGASIAESKGTVYCVTGDGGLQMNIQELQVVVREQLPIKILVLNNHVLGKISEIQQFSYDCRYAQTTRESGYTVPDFRRIAEAYGIRAVSVDSFMELENYRAWLSDKTPCLIDICLEEDSRLIPKVNWNSNQILPEIDAMLQKKAEELLM
ncbi:thiamine pyrophosphate-binding protein [Lachnoclostridium sp. Marseille-P6806]|uniref:thiamine pyrophosphate-binding protein n=1 Tax=Lachnoclostridium sp. Marseille-P6806 TaxID=2364793 RepID=UPI00102FB5F2|nr:thiamine pyrophosphate-dependent enzyme [Lachnoclostridium sp. Marseille-P6806]